MGARMARRSNIAISDQSLCVMNLSCEFCGSTFKTEKGASNHSCEKKKIAGDIGTNGIRKAYDLFDYWFTLNMFSKKGKSKKEFFKSPYFKTFVDLVKYLDGNYVPSGKVYVEWLSRKRIASRDWCKDSTLDRFRKETSRSEDAVELTLKTLEKMAMRCDDCDAHISEFFDTMRPGDIIQWIRNGKMTPWVLLMTDKADEVLSLMNDEQLELLDAIIDLNYWESRFKVSKSSVDAVRHILDEVGL